MRTAEMHQQQVALKQPCRQQQQQAEVLQKGQDSAGCQESANFTAACRLLEQISHMDTIIWRKPPKCIL